MPRPLGPDGEPLPDAVTIGHALAESLARTRAQLGDRMPRLPAEHETPNVLLDPDGDTLPALVAVLEQLAQTTIELGNRVRRLESKLDKRTLR